MHKHNQNKEHEQKVGSGVGLEPREHEPKSTNRRSGSGGNSSNIRSRVWGAGQQEDRISRAGVKEQKSRRAKEQKQMSK